MSKRLPTPALDNWVSIFRHTVLYLQSDWCVDNCDITVLSVVSKLGLHIWAYLIVSFVPIYGDCRCHRNTVCPYLGIPHLWPYMEITDMFAPNAMMTH